MKKNFYFKLNNEKRLFEIIDEQNQIVISSIPLNILKNIVDYYLKDDNLSIACEAEELRERANDRIENLRNLSFGIDKADPNSEFDKIPAYLRRNVELDKNTPQRDDFHSTLHVKFDQENKIEISSPKIYYGGELSDIISDDHSERVFIFLPAKKIDLMDAERLTNACGDFMEALEYELEEESEPILGSFLQNLWFKIKRGSQKGKAEIQEDFAKGKKALELKYVELPTAEQTEKLANSAAKIVELLDKQEEGIVRLGALIVLKKQVDGKPKIIVQQLNFDLINIFDKTPQLLQNLQTTYELLTGDVRGIKHLDESGTEVSST